MAEQHRNPPIFISYRRGDAAFATTAINKHLRESFGDDAIFVDVDSIPLGVDFKEHLEEQVARCDIMLVVIGDEWLCDRLSEAQDYVRLEIEAALRRDIPVIPLLLGDARMPAPEDLPESLRKLAFRQGTVIRPGPDFDTDVQRLVKVLGEVRHWERGADEVVANSVALAVSGSKGPERTGSAEGPEAGRTGSTARRSGSARWLLGLVIIAGVTAAALVALRQARDSGSEAWDRDVPAERAYAPGDEARERAMAEAAQREWEEREAARRAEAERAAAEEERRRIEDEQQAERRAEDERLAREAEARRIWEEQQAERGALEERLRLR